MNELHDIYEKIINHERISEEDAIRLFRSNDILTLGKMANIIRERINGNFAYYVVNRHINYTNICKNRCKFCAFSKDEGEEGAFTLSLQEIKEKATEAVKNKVREFHIVGGLNPKLPFEYYIEMLKLLKSSFPQVSLQAFTAVEIYHISEIANLSIESTLKELKKAGLDAIPGGGAEIFSDRVRQIICPKKIKAKEWLKVMEIAHRLGIRSNATMLYGHVESIKERIEHMLMLRELQDKTQGFMAFIPLPYLPYHTQLGGKATTAYDDIKTFAISRIILDNFAHIKAFWVILGLKFAQVLLSFGADDLDGTVVEEHIAHDAGAETPQSIEVFELRRLIKEAGRIPVERDTIYNFIKNEDRSSSIFKC
jgi:aminodeoxyfutalosine synthase